MSGNGKAKKGDLTEGPILRTLVGLAMPIMASAFLSTVYSITDMAWVGMLGSKAVAGVGVGGMYVWLSSGLASLARMGGQVHMAQCIGRKEREQARRYAQTAVQLVLLFGVLYGLISVIFTRQLVSFFQLDDPEVFDIGVSYMRVTCGLIVIPFLSNTLTGLCTAQGDSKTPLIANLIGVCANIVLDPMFIFGVGFFPELGSIGAAVATIISEAIVLFVYLAVIFLPQKTGTTIAENAESREELSNSEKTSGDLAAGERIGKNGNLVREICILERPKVFYVKNILRIGGPTALQGTVYCLISMVLTRMVSAFGADAIATQRLGGQVEAIGWNTADGFASALNAFIGQNFGAGKKDRIKKSYRAAFLSMSAWGVFITIIFVVCAEPISALFFHEELAIETAKWYFIIVGLGEAFMCIELMTIGALSGLGLTRLCSIISVCVTGARIPIALILCATPLGLHGIWWALSLTSMAKGIIFTVAMRGRIRKL